SGVGRADTSAGNRARGACGHDRDRARETLSPTVFARRARDWSAACNASTALGAGSSKATGGPILLKGWGGGVAGRIVSVPCEGPERFALASSPAGLSPPGRPRPTHDRTQQQGWRLLPTGVIRGPRHRVTLSPRFPRRRSLRPRRRVRFRAAG